MRSLLVMLFSVTISTHALASDQEQSDPLKCENHGNMTIKTLSPEDIAELKRGGGWGLAKAAELNGVPGPKHLLELKDDIALDRKQVSAITEIFEQMKADAIRQGERLIASERDLNTRFLHSEISDSDLRLSLVSAEKARMELRYIHLAAHLKTPRILSKDQIEKYTALRQHSRHQKMPDASKEHKGH